MIKVLKKKSSEILDCPIPEFEKEMGISWLNEIRFQTPHYLQRILRKSKRALKRNELSVRQKWLGTYFQKEVLKGVSPDVSIRYINSELGYGVFAESDFSAGSYIGEYTGLVRKRRKRADNKNNYCFEYSIGDWIYNPFIIDAKERGNFTRFINHDEDPNIEPLSVCVEGVMHIIFVALKKIEPGTQLCYHYGDTFWKKRRHAKKLDLNIKN